MRYRVTRQFGPDQERDERPFAEFDEIEDAKFLVEKLIEKFGPLKTPAIFRIYKSFDLIQESNAATAQLDQSSQGSSSSGGKTSSASARPTPFSTTLRPSGMPAGWGKKEDDEGKK